MNNFEDETETVTLNSGRESKADRIIFIPMDIYFYMSFPSQKLSNL